jgi:hypothetical protein
VINETGTYLSRHLRTFTRCQRVAGSVAHQGDPITLATFLSNSSKRPHVGVVINTTTLLDLTAEDPGSGHSHFESIQALIDDGQAGLESARTILQRASSDPSHSTVVEISEVRFCAPIPQPRKNVFCVGLNYPDHIQEGNKAQDKQSTPQIFPEFFTKAPTTIIAAGDGIPSHAGTTSQVDYEGGARGRYRKASG